MKNIFIIIFFYLLSACNAVDFVYNDNKNVLNPIYGKVGVSTAGEDLVYLKSYIPMFFGSGENEEFSLSIFIEEKKTNRSVETNQATSNLLYELRFYYILKSNREKCQTYEKEILSSFSIIPKSSGFNYGTDASLEKKYEIAVTENLNQFMSLLSNVDLHECT